MPTLGRHTSATATVSLQQLTLITSRRRPPIGLASSCAGTAASGGKGISASPPRAATTFAHSTAGVRLALAYALLARRRGFEAWAALDLLAATLGIPVGVARIGCFLAGCDHGTITEVPWAVRYPAGTAAFGRRLAAGLVQASDAASLPVHPAQLHETLVGLTRVLAVVALQRRGLRRSRPLAADALFVASAMIYAVGRFLVEMVRGDDRGMLGPLSTPQWLSVAVVLYLGGCAPDAGIAEKSISSGSEGM